MDVRVGLWRKLSSEELVLLNCGVGEDSWESLGLQGDPTSPFWRRSVLSVHWKDRYWSWNSDILATWWEELTQWKRPWCWEGLGAGGEGDDRGWDGWMASPTRWTWVWVNSRSWWWTGRPGVLWFMGSQRVRHDWATELNWTAWGGRRKLTLSMVTTLQWLYYYTTVIMVMCHEILDLCVSEKQFASRIPKWNQLVFHTQGNIAYCLMLREDCSFTWSSSLWSYT